MLQEVVLHRWVVLGGDGAAACQLASTSAAVMLPQVAEASDALGKMRGIIEGPRGDHPALVTGGNAQVCAELPVCAL